MVFNSSTPSDSITRARRIQRVTIVAICTNVVLTIGQISIGLFANAFSLVADAMHTLTDLITDTLVLFAGKKGAKPADREHPYGHARIETIVSMLLGMSLMIIGLGFLVSTGIRLQNLQQYPALHTAALYMALLTLIVKELLFRFTLRAAKKLQAPILEANAWHARSDALSSLVVAIGIGGSLAGFRFLEPLAAALVGFLIITMGVRLAWRAIQELIDTGLSAGILTEIEKTILETPGVLGVHDLRTRRMGGQVLCDVHIRVPPYISVSEGHLTGNKVHKIIQQKFPHIQDILIHIDVEDDFMGTEASGTSSHPNHYSRSEILLLLHRFFDKKILEKAIIELHFLHQQIDVIILLPADTEADGKTLNQQITQIREQYPMISKIEFFRLIAPK